MKKKDSLKILITAGPTREMLDPVRFISNVSTGEMGYALAAEAAKKGHDVTLISGPTSLRPPSKVLYIPIVSAVELKKACEKHFPNQDALVMVAAVCDFMPEQVGKQKIRRTQVRTLRLKQTPDIVAGLGAVKGNRKVIAFCLETENWIENAKAKLVRKHLDGIVANYYSQSHVPFGNRRINTAFIEPDGRVRRLNNKRKQQIAAALLKWLQGMTKKVVS